LNLSRERNFRLVDSESICDIKPIRETELVFINLANRMCLRFLWLLSPSNHDYNEYN